MTIVYQCKSLLRQALVDNSTESHDDSRANDQILGHVGLSVLAWLLLIADDLLRLSLTLLAVTSESTHFLLLLLSQLVKAVEQIFVFIHVVQVLSKGLVLFRLLLLSLEVLSPLVDGGNILQLLLRNNNRGALALRDFNRIAGMSLRFQLLHLDGLVLEPVVCLHDPRMNHFGFRLSLIVSGARGLEFLSTSGLGLQLSRPSLVKVLEHVNFLELIKKLPSGHVLHLLQLFLLGFEVGQQSLELLVEGLSVLGLVNRLNALGKIELAKGLLLPSKG